MRGAPRLVLFETWDSAPPRGLAISQKIAAASTSADATGQRPAQSNHAPDLTPRQRRPTRAHPAPRLHRHETNPKPRDISQTAPSCTRYPDKAVDSSLRPALRPAPRTKHPEEQRAPPARQYPPPCKPLCSSHKQNGSAEYDIHPPVIPLCT